MVIGQFAALGAPEQAQIIADFEASDELLHTLHSMMSGPVETDIPFFEDVNHPISYRNQISGLTKTEPFLGFMSGMSTYQISKIWNPVQSSPLLLQDYTYSFVDEPSKPQFFGGDEPGSASISIDNGANQVPNTLLRITRTGDTTLNIRERRTQDQAAKSVSNLNYYYPLIEETDSLNANPILDGGQNIECSVKILSEYGPSQYLFVYAERKLDYRQTFYVNRYPTIIGLDLEFVYNGKRLCSYLLNETELWKATRKNHHVLQSTSDLKLKEGAVLLSRSDIGFWGVDEFRKSDLLELRVHATVRQQPQAGAEPVLSFNARKNSLIRLTTALIHPDRLFISGTTRAITFSKIK